MKNIHILPTDKPSRLYLHSDNELQLRTNIIRTSEDYLGSNQHIYITSNEESKEKRLRFIIDNREGMYGFIHQVSVVLDSKICPEIILTTEQDLIKDGVQAIDDEFLEWFVKNPSCEEVEVIKGFADSTSYGFNFLDYKIIIPKEEPKQETFEEAAERLAKDSYKKHYVKDDKLSLDEQIQRSGGFIVGFKEGMIEGAKWQQERMYSEEEVQVKLYECLGHFAQKHNIIINSSEIDQWFKQFKKK